MNQYCLDLKSTERYLHVYESGAYMQLNKLYYIISGLFFTTQNGEMILHFYYIHFFSFGKQYLFDFL